MVVALKPQPLPWPVTPEWRKRVRDELDDRPRGEMTKLADHLKVSTGHLSDILSGKYQTSDLVEPIHAWFGWEAPLPPTASIDAGELLYGANRMTAAQRAFLVDAKRMLEGAAGDDARLLIEAMLKAWRTKND